MIKEFLRFQGIRKNLSNNRTLNWGHKMEHELEEVERDYIEFRKEIGEENQDRVEKTA